MKQDQPESQTTAEPYKPIKSFGEVWLARYWTARWFISLGLWVLPPCRYKTELLAELWAMRRRVEEAVKCQEQKP